MKKTKSLKTQKKELLNEMFGTVHLHCASSQQPPVSMQDLKLLGLKVEADVKTTAGNKDTHLSERKLALIQIYKKLNEAIELANDFNFKKLSVKLTEVKTGMNKKLVK